MCHVDGAETVKLPFPEPEPKHEHSQSNALLLNPRMGLIRIALISVVRKPIIMSCRVRNNIKLAEREYSEHSVGGDGGKHRKGKRLCLLTFGYEVQG